MLSELAPALAWTYSYPARAGQPDLSSAVAFSQIIGPGGIRRSDRLRLGLTLIAPGTHYPPHAHPAVETYLVIAGTAFWRLGEAPAAAQPPGALILHPSGAAHAMQTGAEPLLAIWSWRGDVTSPSVSSSDPPADILSSLLKAKLSFAALRRPAILCTGGFRVSRGRFSCKLSG